jgi:hypothetical protein
MPKEYCQNAIARLATLSGQAYGEAWCNMKMEFHRLFQGGLIFSTRFGAAFFEETLGHLERKETLKPFAGEPLGEYDANFNKWIKKYI